MKAMAKLLLILGVLVLPQVGSAQTPQPPAPGGTPRPERPVVTTGMAGVVLDHEAGTPVANGTVTVTPGDLKATTDDNGKFAIDIDDWKGLPKDPIPADARKGMVPEIGRVTVTVEAGGYGIWTTKNQDVHRDLTVNLEVHLYATPVTQDYTCTPGAIAAVKRECAGAPEPTSIGEAAMKAEGSQAVTASCSGYYSDVTPPPTIRILYNNQVWTRDFKTYVKEVLPREWVVGWKLESLQAGAMAVRNYGWYAVNHGPRGWHNGECFDVYSTTADQVWAPGGTNVRTDEAVDSIWAAGRMTRGGIVFPAYYKSGLSSDTCGYHDLPPENCTT